MVNITVDEALKTKCNVYIGYIEAIVNVKPSDEDLVELINNKCKEISTNIQQNEILSLKNINSSRRAYKSLGKDPSRYRLSSESLIKRVVKRRGIYFVNNIVEINNLLSLETCYSVGSYDLDKIEGNILFTVGKEGERYEGIGRGLINLENLPVLQDNKGKFGSTTSDSVMAMITKDTTHIIMNIIAFEPDKNMYQYINYGIDLLKKYADATILNTKIVY